jgi:hypothetical protein
MLKKMLIVVAALVVATPALAYQVGNSWSQVPMNDLERAAVKDDAGNIIGYDWVGDGRPSGDRTVDWEKDGDWTQRKAEVWNWPATYDFVPVCNIPVKMEVGFWIQLKGCRDKSITLKQYAINKYRGQIDCTVSANVATEWRASFTMTHATLKAARDYIRVDKDPGKTGGDGTTAKFSGADVPTKDKTIWIALGLKETDLFNTAPTQECLTIGYVTVQVRPSVRPNEYMSGCSGSGAGYGTAGYNYYAPQNLKGW